MKQNYVVIFKIIGICVNKFSSYQGNGTNESYSNSGLYFVAHFSSGK